MPRRAPGSIVEAVPENPQLKADVFRELDAVAPVMAILGIQHVIRSRSRSSRPRHGARSRFVGMHFMNPVPVMQLVEVIRGLQTSDETTQRSWSWRERLGKTPVEVNDFPGFVSNRMLMPMINEAIFCLMEGVAEPEAIDTVMKLGMNHPMGPLALADLIGLDTCLAILEVLHAGARRRQVPAVPAAAGSTSRPAGWAGRRAAASTSTDAWRRVRRSHRARNCRSAALRASSRQAELRPHVEAWDRDRTIRPRRCSAQLAELGFFGMRVPEEHGGMGFDLPTYVAALEELAWGEASVAMLVARHAAAADLILRLGTEEQKARWLPALASGETLAALAHWDPDADAPATLEREAGGLALRGVLARVVRGASTGLVVARVREQDGAPGAVLVPADAPGFRVRRAKRRSGSGRSKW